MFKHLLQWLNTIKEKSNDGISRRYYQSEVLIQYPLHLSSLLWFHLLGLPLRLAMLRQPLRFVTLSSLFGVKGYCVLRFEILSHFWFVFVTVVAHLSLVLNRIVKGLFDTLSAFHFTLCHTIPLLCTLRCKVMPLLFSFLFGVKGFVITSVEFVM